MSLSGARQPLSDASNKKRSRFSSIFSPNGKTKKPALRNTPASFRNVQHKTPSKVRQANTSERQEETTPVTPTQTSPNLKHLRSPFSSTRLFSRRKQEEDPPEDEWPICSKTLDATLARVERSTSEILNEKLEEAKKTNGSTFKEWSGVVRYLEENNRSERRGWLRKEVFGRGSGWMRDDEKSFMQQFTPLDKTVRVSILDVLSFAWGCDSKTLKGKIPKAVESRLGSVAITEPSSTLGQPTTSHFNQSHADRPSFGRFNTDQCKAMANPVKMSTARQGE